MRTRTRVDSASGTEAAPGHKDPDKLRAFFDAVARSAGRERRPATASRRERGAPAERGGRAPLRPLRRPVRARDADAGAGELEQAWLAARAATPPTAPSSTGCCATSAGARRRCTAPGASPSASGGRVYLKREDLNHTGSHKLNNALGQALLAQRMGKRRIIAETGAGQHGVATATVCALLGLECVVYMGVEDTRRQRPNVQRMELLGATRAAGRRRRAGRSRRRPRRRSATG